MITPIPPAYTIGKSSYPDMSHNSIPGPGEYEKSLKPSQPLYSFSRSPRKLHAYAEIPGPGVYEPSRYSKSPGFALSKTPRQLSNYQSLSPGPGVYSYTLSQSKYQYSISKARARSYNLSDSPGPGYYSPNTHKFVSNPNFVKFLKDRRMPIVKNLTPAPGQYDLVDLHKRKGFTIPRAYIKKFENYSPGPGVYEIPSTIGIASLK